jgi:hypothetical protein
MVLLQLKRWQVGFYDRTGRFIIKPQFNLVWGFSDGMAKVYLNKKYGFVSKEGQVIEPQFDDASFFENALAVVQKGYLRGLINKEGKFIIEPQFNFLDDFKEGMALFEIGI